MPAAIERSLKILECLALSRKPVTFTEINKALGNISRASLSRMLAELIEQGYVYKNDSGGCYESGYRMGIFAMSSPRSRRESLIEKYRAALKTISTEFDVTGIILENVSGIPVTVWKTQTDSSVSMAVVGAGHPNRDDLWMKILAAYDKKVMLRYNENEQKEIYTIRNHGHYFENCEIRVNFVRIGFPFFEPDNPEILAGILGIGASPLQINQENATEIINYTKELLANR